MEEKRLSADELKDIVGTYLKSGYLKEKRVDKKEGYPCNKCFFLDQCPRKASMVCMRHMRKDRKSVFYERCQKRK